MGLDITTQANLQVEKLANQAVGRLYQMLDFVPKSTLWRTTQKIENGGTFSVPILGALASNTRAPGAPVTPQTPAPTKRTITIGEREITIPMDPTWNSSEGSVKYAEQIIMSAINDLAGDVLADILSVIAQTAGLTQIGTLGNDLTKANFDAARKALDDGKIRQDGRLAVLSTDMGVNVGNITEFADYDTGGIAAQHATGRVRMADGFEIKPSAYAYSPAANQHIGFFCDPQSIWTVFPMQETFNKGEVAVKIEQEMDGLRLYLLREYLAGYNGAEQWTFSCRFGTRVGRDAGVGQFLGK